MTRTYPLWGSVPEAEKPFLAQPYGSSSVNPTKLERRMVIDGCGAAGSIVSNVEDMQLWMTKWLDLWYGKPQSLVSAASSKQFRTPVMPFPALNALSGSYALGTWIEQYRDAASGKPLVIQHHGGNLAGMSSMTGVVIGDADSGSAITVLVNQVYFIHALQSLLFSHHLHHICLF